MLDKTFTVEKFKYEFIKSEKERDYLGFPEDLIVENTLIYYILNNNNKFIYLSDLRDVLKKLFIFNKSDLISEYVISETKYEDFINKINLNKSKYLQIDSTDNYKIVLNQTKNIKLLAYVDDYLFKKFIKYIYKVAEKDTKTFNHINIYIVFRKFLNEKPIVVADMNNVIEKMTDFIDLYDLTSAKAITYLIVKNDLYDESEIISGKPHLLNLYNKLFDEVPSNKPIIKGYEEKYLQHENKDIATEKLENRNVELIEPSVEIFSDTTNSGIDELLEKAIIDYDSIEEDIEKTIKEVPENTLISEKNNFKDTYKEEESPAEVIKEILPNSKIKDTEDLKIPLEKSSSNKSTLLKKLNLNKFKTIVEDTINSIPIAELTDNTKNYLSKNKRTLNNAIYKEPIQEINSDEEFRRIVDSNKKMIKNYLENKNRFELVDLIKDMSPEDIAYFKEILGE